MAVYVISESGNRAMDKLRTDLEAKVGRIQVGRGGIRYIMTAAEAMRQYNEGVRIIVANGAYVETHDGRTISVKCGSCGLCQIIYARVRRYVCRCNPRKERFTFQDIQTGE